MGAFYYDKYTAKTVYTSRTNKMEMIAMKKIKKNDRVITQCTKCNKPYSYDANKGWKFGTLCRECGEKKKG